MSSRVALWFAAAEQDNLALALETVAQRLAEDRVQIEDAPGLEPLYQALQSRLDALPAEDMAEPGDVVGFDRPATLHLISPALLNPYPLTSAGLIQNRSALLLAVQ